MSDEPFRIQLTATARRCLHRLPEKIVGACIEFIAGPLAVDPHRIGKPLQRELAGSSARRGAYRVVYRIDDSARTVVVVRVDHRGDVYRSRTPAELVAETEQRLASEGSEGLLPDPRRRCSGRIGRRIDRLRCLCAG